MSGPRKVLGDVSNTNKRVVKASKPLINIAADVDAKVQSKKKEKKESIPIFAGGAPGDDRVSLAKLSRELDECFEAFSKPAHNAFTLPDAVFALPDAAIERRSPNGMAVTATAADQEGTTLGAPAPC